MATRSRIHSQQTLPLINTYNSPHQVPANLGINGRPRTGQAAVVLALLVRVTDWVPAQEMPLPGLLDIVLAAIMHTLDALVLHTSTTMT